MIGPKRVRTRDGDCDGDGGDGDSHDLDHLMISPTSLLSSASLSSTSTLSSSSMFVEEGEKVVMMTEAVTTLQKATRRMLARKSFKDIQNQAIASLVIQRSVMLNWQRKRGGGTRNHK